MSQPMFQFLKELIDKLSVSAVNYSDYLVSNLESITGYQYSKEVERKKNFFTAVFKKESQKKLTLLQNMVHYVRNF